MYNSLKSSDSINLYFESKIIKLEKGESLIDYDIAKLEDPTSSQKMAIFYYVMEITWVQLIMPEKRQSKRSLFLLRPRADS